MSVGPLGGIAAGVAGAPLAQTKGSETERTSQDSAAQQRRVDTDQKAESAAGIGETDGEDHETGERDADGRRPWQAPPNVENEENGEQDEQSKKDDSRETGNLLDLSG